MMETKNRLRSLAAPLAAGILAFGYLASGAAVAQSADESADYEHDKFAPDTADIRRSFEAFVVSFDSKDDDDGDGMPDLRRVPEWVAQEIRRFAGECVNTRRRPSRWSTDRGLYSSGVAPNDASYAGSGFDRGHLAAEIACRSNQPGRGSQDAHGTQRGAPIPPIQPADLARPRKTTQGPGRRPSGKIWVVQGPVFYNETKPENARWIGDAEKGERLVAVPDALFKIVVRESESGESLQTLAFLYPQLGARYYGRRAEFAHERFLTTVSEIERLTGLSFSKLQMVRSIRATSLWEAAEGDYITGCAGSG